MELAPSFARWSLNRPRTVTENTRRWYVANLAPYLKLTPLTHVFPFRQQCTYASHIS